MLTNFQCSASFMLIDALQLPHVSPFNTLLFDAYKSMMITGLLLDPNAMRGFRDMALVSDRLQSAKLLTYCGKTDARHL